MKLLPLILMAEWFLTGLAHDALAPDTLLPQTMRANQIAIGNGTYVAVDGQSNVMTSPDGRAWTRREAGTVFRLYVVAFGAGLFVAVRNVGASLLSHVGLP